ncbi:MAG: ABC transporter substrate-binding protein [Candidatus Eisenbacteria bacterium]
MRQLLRLEALCLGLVAVLVLALPGCGRAPDGTTETPPKSEPARGGVLRVLHESAKDLDPRVIDDIYEGTVANQIFEGLVRYDPSLGIAPSLAESWIVADGGLLYTFHLRDDVHFHDGTPLEASGVVASLERVLSPERTGDCIAETYLLQIEGAAAYRAGRAVHVTGLRAPDPSTVEIELEEPLSFFLAALAMDQTRIVSTVSPPGKGAVPIGTGPFAYVGRHSDGETEELVLRRNTEYWGEPAYLDSLVFVSHLGQTPTDEAKISMLLAGKVDGIDVASRHISHLRTLGYLISATPEPRSASSVCRPRRHPRG